MFRVLRVVASSSLTGGPRAFWVSYQRDRFEQARLLRSVVGGGWLGNLGEQLVDVSAVTRL